MKVNIAKKVQNKEGFTLVELMIVVAIIGILAAIAIPQFAAYRTRGFNSAALSDVRNLNTSEATLFADWQRFGVTAATAGAAWAVPAALPAGAALVVGGDANGDGIVTSDLNGTPRGLQIAVGNGVSIIASTNVVPAAAGNATAFNAEGKHLNGDTIYAVDSDSTAVYQDPATLAAGTAYPGPGIYVAATAATDDYAAAGAPWVIK